MVLVARLIAPLQKIYPRWPHLITVARLDRPIGIYLLLWPTLWGLWIAAEGWPGWHLLIVFVLGTVLTRSAGCIINDIADREFDGQVKRTLGRPLATGDLPIFDAVVFMSILLFLALILVLSTNLLTLGLSFIGAIVAGIYPFMKRYTYMPQVVLGVAFSMGIPMAFAAVTGSVPNVAWILFCANLLWTTAYDTQYAMVDRDDDLKLGLKSTAILFGELDRIAIGVLQILFLFTLYLGARTIEASALFYIGFAVAAALLIWQQKLIANRDRDQCFQSFLANHWVGLAIFTGIALQYLPVFSNGS